jgi:protoheme IX farnesyltransferase
MSLASEGLRSNATVAPSLAEVGDYIDLLKPRVMSLVVFTALVGIMLAPGHVHPVIGAVSLLCIAIGAGAAGALNMWYDADIDGLMRRTVRRPIPAGRVLPGEALAFGLTLSVGAVVMLGLVANVLAAALLAFTIFFYIVIYTMWLKRSTPQNIVIGGAAGALPPVVGWAAVTGHLGLEPLILFAIIFLWTPPHTWALALYSTEDYGRAGVPMLPVVIGTERTKRWIMAYSVPLVLVAVAPWLLGHADAVYGTVSIVAGLGFLGLAARLWRANAAATESAAKHLFGFSILYLLILFTVLLIEGALGGLFGRAVV